MSFENKIETKTIIKKKNPFDMYRDYFFRKVKDKNPILYKNEKIDREEFKKIKNGVVLLGHSSTILKVDGLVFLTDPVLKDGRVGPLNLVGPKKFRYENNYTKEVLPEKIDGVLISHNHYDHLDLPTIKSIDERVEKFFVPSGLKKILVKSRIKKEKIVELGWYEESKFKGVKVILTPTRHFSGRGLFDRNSTLWGSWVVKGEKTVFFSGDTGYFDEFKVIGEKYGPFDMTLIECGAYSEYWAKIHLMPEESVEVGKDLKSKLIIPIHNRKYDLSLHKWDEPLIRFEKKVKKEKITGYKIPNIGEVIKY